MPGRRNKSTKFAHQADLQVVLDILEALPAGSPKRQAFVIECQKKNKITEAVSVVLPYVQSQGTGVDKLLLAC
jgi:hypothetical protein